MVAVEVARTPAEHRRDTHVQGTDPPQMKKKKIASVKALNSDTFNKYDQKGMFSFLNATSNFKSNT